MFIKMFTYTMLARSQLHDMKASDSNRKYNYFNSPRHGTYTCMLLTPPSEGWVQICETTAALVLSGPRSCTESSAGPANKDLPLVGQEAHGKLLELQTSSVSSAKMRIAIPQSMVLRRNKGEKAWKQSPQVWHVSSPRFNSSVKR